MTHGPFHIHRVETANQVAVVTNRATFKMKCTQAYSLDFRYVANKKIAPPVCHHLKYKEFGITLFHG